MMLGTAAQPEMPVAGPARTQRRRRQRDIRAQGTMMLGAAVPTGDGPAVAQRRRRHRPPPLLLSL
eukprot:1882054-Heterocapsa_arctica.AAC.1